MRRSQYLLIVTLTVISGLVGGAASNWLFMERTVVAQEEKHNKVIIAEEFRLVDEDGKICAILGKNPEDTEENGWPSGLVRRGLWLYDKNNDKCASISVDCYGPSLRLFHESEMRAVFEIGLEGMPQLFFVDRPIDIPMPPDQSPIPPLQFLQVFRDVAPWQARVLLALSPEGSPSLSLYDDKKMRATFGLTKNGSPVLGFLNRNEQSRMMMTLENSPDGAPSISLFGGNNQLRANLGIVRTIDHLPSGEETSAQTKLSLYDEDFKLIWRAPDMIQ